MKREQIIEILKKYQDRTLCIHKSNYNSIADEILASHPEPQPQEQEKSMEQKQTAGVLESAMIIQQIWRADNKNPDWEKRAETVGVLMEYATQKHITDESPVLPSEQEIKKKARSISISKSGTPDGVFYDVCIQMTKWFKSQLKQGYPKEFSIWCIDNVVRLYYRDEKYSVKGTQTAFKSIDELYQYWIDNVKDK